MEVIEAILGRRSCRRYLPDPVPEDLLQKIVDAGIWAPSGTNRQWTHFVVVQGNKWAEIAEYCWDVGQRSRERFENLFSTPTADMMMDFYRNIGTAPVIIMVYVPSFDVALGTDSTKMPPGSPEANRFNAIVSAAAAVENMHLAAHSLGLGSIWMSLPRRNCHAINDALSIQDMELIAGLLVGYEAKTPPVPPRRGERIQWIGFGPEREGKWATWVGPDGTTT